MAVENLTANKRDDVGKSTVKENRKKGNVPGVFYMKGGTSIPFYVKDNAIRPFIYTSDMKIISLTIDGTDIKHNCILKDIQFDPVTDRPIHIDLLGISENESITVEVPVNIMGTAAGIKEGGILQHTMHKLELKCLPKDIPAHIDVDISKLMIGDAVHVEDLKYDNVEFTDSPSAIIVSVVPPLTEKAAEAEAPVEGEEAAAEPEVITKGKKEEDEE